MPITILPQDQDGQKLFNAISSFFRTYEVGKLLRKCNAQKEKGVPVLDIFKYKLCNVFSGRRISACREIFISLLDSEEQNGI